MKVKLFIVAIICLLQSCSTTDFLDEQRVETISNDNNEVSYVIPLEDALKNVEKVLDCINGASVSRASSLKSVKNIGEFYQFNLSSCIRQQNSLTAQFVSFSLSNLANIFYPPQFLQ